MRRAAGLLAAVVPGGAALLGLVGVGMFAAMYRAARSGVAAVDAWAIRGNAVIGLLMAWRLEASPAVARAFVAGVTVNEDASRPGDARFPSERFPRGRLGYYPTGDVGHRLGPAVSPWQILSGLHLRRLGYAGDPLELARVGNELSAAYYAAVIFREAFEEASRVLGAGAARDERLRWAVARYNGKWKDGSFPEGAAKYADRAWSRILALGGLPS